MKRAKRPERPGLKIETGGTHAVGVAAAMSPERAGESSSPVSESRPGAPVLWVWLARIRHPQGRKGEVFADILTDFPEKFAERRRLWLLSESSAAPREVELRAHWLHKGGVVLHFAGVETITDAEALAGLVVAVPRAERAAPAADELHIADLIGCEVVDVAANPPVAIGVIENVERAAGMAPILMVRGARGEVLIPFAQSYLRKVDLEGRRVEMELPEGLVGLNEGVGNRE